MYLGRKVIIVVAATENDVIGHGMKIPMDIPEGVTNMMDTMTLGKTIVLGRKTLQSIVSPFAGRKNVILSKHDCDNFEGVELGDQKIYINRSIEGAICMDESEAWILGGQKVYKAALPYADEIRYFRLPGKVPGDKFFRFNAEEWTLKTKEEKEGFVYTVLVRR